MAPSSPAESISEQSRDFSGSDLSDQEENGGVKIQTKALKRRRLSESDGSDSGSESESDNDKIDVIEDDGDDEPAPAPAPLPTMSRIKKKDDKSAPAPQSDKSNPELIRDAIEIGLQNAESSFKTINVAPWLIGSLTTMAVRKPTAIQKACIPEILKGRDCIGGSRTGSGKTIAFAVPMLQKWAEDPFGIFGLILTPTRYVSCHHRRDYVKVLMIAENLRCRFLNMYRRFRRHRV